MRRCSTSYVIKELQIKTSRIITAHLLEWQKSQTLTTSNAGKVLEQQDLSFLVVMQNGIITLDDSVAGLPRWRCGKESACQCRRHMRHRLDPWVGKIPWSRKWHLTPVFLPGKFHGQRSLTGYSLWGCKELVMTE